jgi:hypothetical protein
MLQRSTSYCTHELTQDTSGSYAPTFLIPVTGTSGGPVKYVPKTMLGAIVMTGQVLSSEEHKKAETLDSILAKAYRPLVIFPEGTTSNNVRY